MTRKELAEKATELLDARTKAKELYSRADVLLDEIMDEVKPGEEIKLADGKKAAIVDQFRDKSGKAKNVVWKPAGVKRYDLELVG